MSLDSPTADSDDGSPVADRAAESAARLVLALVPVVGPVLAEAVGYARSVHDDQEAAAFRVEVRRRLASLESAATTATDQAVRVSGDRARLLELLVRRAGEELLRRVRTQEAMDTLGLTAEACRRAVREFVDLGVIEVDLNGNNPTGYERAAVYPSIYVQLIGRFDSSINVARELGLILQVLERAGEDTRVRRDAFAELGIPVRRLQVLAEYLEAEGLAIFHPSASWLSPCRPRPSRGRR